MIFTANLRKMIFWGPKYSKVFSVQLAFRGKKTDFYEGLRK